MKKSEVEQYRRHEDGYPAQRVASDTFQIRRAAAQDADIISWHRARMFQDMGDVSEDAFEILRTKARTRLEQWIDNGNYIGWLATPADEPETVVGGAGIQLQPILPRPLDVSTIGEGRQGTIVNVFNVSTGSYFTRRTTGAQFTNGSDSSPATKCISPAFLSSSARRCPIGFGVCRDELHCRLGRPRDDVAN
jgi:hypothetical protein